MASMRCSRCLPPSSRPLLSASRIAAISSSSTPPPLPGASQAFSTTPSQNGNFEKIVAKKGVHRVGLKHQQAASEKKTVQRGPPVHAGERKAFRKRITLSNTNALPVELAKQGPRSFSSPDNVGKMIALRDDTLDKLRTATAFKPTQTWNMFRQPATLVRRETVDLCGRMDERVKKGEMLRCIISGDKVTGKSMLVVQALAHAYENGWIVVNIPEGQDLTNAQVDYAPIEKSELWAQPSTMQQLCRQLSANNSKILTKMHTTRQHPELGSLQQGTMNLNTLANAAKDSEDAAGVFQALFYELTQVPDRPPIVFCLDGLSHVMKMSAYRTKDFKQIHAHDLAVIRKFCDLFGGVITPSGGGAIIGATGKSNCPKNKSVDYAVAYKEAKLVDKLPEDELPPREPYCSKYDPRVDEVLKDTEIVRVSGVDRREARAIMEYWAASGMYRHPVDERRIAETWSLGGHGIIGEMERASLKHSRV